MADSPRGGEIVALDPDGTEYLAINRTGAAIWPLLQDGATEAELVVRLTTAYEVDEATASRDVRAFLDMARHHGLVT